MVCEHARLYGSTDRSSVFGLYEKHQRSDRRSIRLTQFLVLTLCRRKVCPLSMQERRRYEKALKQAKAVFVDKSDDWMEKYLCEDILFAGYFKFGGRDYIKIPGLSAPDNSPKFDLKSIMLYSSRAGTTDLRCHWGLLACPLVAYGPKGLERIEPNMVPSPTDCELLKKWYKHGQTGRDG